MDMETQTVSTTTETTETLPIIPPIVFPPVTPPPEPETSIEPEPVPVVPEPEARNVAIIDVATNIVENVILANELFKWPDETKLLIASDIGCIGDTYDADSGEFTKPPIPPMLAETAIAGIYQAINEQTFAITGQVPTDEKLSWLAKEAAARAFKAGSATDEQAALLDGETSITGETTDALADKIILNADAYRAAIATLTGIRRNAETAIASAEPDDIKGIFDDTISAIRLVGAGTGDAGDTGGDGTGS